MNKVIFLDFDGPLITYRTIVANGGLPKHTDGVERRFFDETALKLISSIARVAKAGIVVSSTFRDSPCFERMGQNLGLPIIGRLDPFRDPMPIRGEEIRQWLEKNPNVKNYAIVDDDKDFYDYQKPYLVSTPEEDGFTWSCAVQLAKILDINIWDVNKPR